MGIFGKKKHGLIDVIRYEGSPDVLIWKHDCEDFNTNCQLIVNEGQEAIFIKNGQALESFLPGRYTLDSQNYPFIRTLVGAVTRGINPFQCSVYFVNKGISMGIDWGTDSPIRIQDPVYKLPIDITAYGDFSVSVDNPKQILTSFVANSKGFTLDELQKYFSSMMATKIRSIITTALVSNHLSPLGIDAYLDAISNQIFPKIVEMYNPYGLRVNHFTIANIGYSGLEEVEATLGKEMVSDITFAREAERRRLDADVEVENKLKHGKADNSLFLEKGKYIAEVNTAQGITELQKQMIEVATKQAENPGPILGGSNVGLGFGGGVYSMGGYGTGLKTTGANATESLRIIAGMNSGITTPLSEQSDDNSPLSMPGGLDGVMEAASGDDFDERIMKLTKLKTSDIITEDEYNNLKQQLIDEVMGNN